MKKARIRQFINGLKRARAAVKRGATGCETAGDRCWRCAMKYHSGLVDFSYSMVDPKSGQRIAFDSDWSFRRSREETLALFDNSIAAVSESLNQITSEKP